MQLHTLAAGAALALLTLCLVPRTARAQGIPVIDAANLIQTIQQVMDDITAIENQVQQIKQLQTQLDSMNGVRNLGNVFNSPLLQNYIPAQTYSVLNLISASGVEDWPEMSKNEVGARLAVRIADILKGAA